MTDDIRKPPVRAVLALHKQGVRGSCGWCGLPVEEKTAVRGWLKFWHDACAFEMAIIEQPGRARAAVFARDRGVCVDCGEDWSGHFRLIPTYRERDGTPRVMFAEQMAHDAWPNGYYLSTTSYPRENAYACIELTAVSLWHVDHHIPLWKVAHMAPLQRLEYFKLANLRTRCDPCHERKTSKEAAEKARLDGLSKPRQQKPKREWPKRKMRSRNTFQGRRSQ